MKTINKYLIMPGAMELVKAPPLTDGLCIYYEHCNNPLDGSEEHILNASWDGISTSPDLICSKCNSDFSTPVDDSFRGIIDRVKNAKALIIKGKKNPPSIFIDDQVKFAPYAKLVAINRQLDIDSSKPIIDKIAVPLDNQYRSAAHTCLKAIGYFFPLTPRHEIFRDIRDFIHNGAADFTTFAIDTWENNEFLPSRWQSEVLGKNHVLIYFSKRLNKVVGVVRIQGIIKRSVILANECAVDEQVLTVHEDSTKGIVALLKKYVVDRDLPPFVVLTGKEINDDYIYDQLTDLKKWISAMAPSYELDDYLSGIQRDKTVLSSEVLSKVADRVYGFTLLQLNKISTDAISLEDVTNALTASGLKEFLSSHSDQLMDAQFRTGLKEIWQSASKRINPDIRLLNHDT